MDLPLDTKTIPSAVTLWLRRALLNLSVTKSVLLFFGIYALSGFFFAFLYKLSPPETICSGNQASNFFECLYFSFTTQATVGYGEFVPCGIDRLTSVVQAAIGILFNAAGTGIIILRLIRRSPNIAFPDFLCYDPKNHSFVFRIWNTDHEGLAAVSISIFLTKPIPIEQDELVRHMAYQIDLQWECTPYIENNVIVILRSMSNRGEPVEATSTNPQKKIVISPLDLSGDETITIYISGTSRTGGDSVFAYRTYTSKEIKCGIYKDAEESFRINYKEASQSYASRTGSNKVNYDYFHTIIPTQDSVCFKCGFHPQCKLDVATRVKTALPEKKEIASIEQTALLHKKKNPRSKPSKN